MLTSQLSDPELIITVVIPALNEEKNIRRIIGAVLQNAYNFPHFEIVVADSGSTDNTVQEVQAACEEALKLRIKLQCVRAGRGPGSARNTGADHSAAKYLFFLDADTIIHSTFLRENLERMQTRGLVAAGIYMKPDSNKWIDKLLVGMLNTYLAVAQYTNQAAAFGAALFFKRDIFKSMGGFDPQIGFGEDIDLIQRTVRKGHPFRMLPTSVITSARRAEKDGRWKLLKQVLRLSWHALRYNTTKGADIEYRFGHYDTKTKEEDLD